MSLRLSLLVYAPCLLLCIVLSNCATKPYALTTAPQPEGPRPHRAFVVGHGWHVGLVLPTESLIAKLPELKSRFPNASYLEIGWGDKGFYQSEEITTSLTLQAMFWSSGSVLHVVAIPQSANPPFDYFPASDIVELCVSNSELSALLEFVSRSFRRDAENHLVKMRQGIYGDSQFYEGEGRYFAMNTCNKWVAKGLSSMGYGIDPTFKLTSASVLDWLKASGNVVREGSDGIITAPLGRSAACTSK